MTVKKDHTIMDIHQVTLITMDLTVVMVENQLVNGKAWVILLYSLSSALLFTQCTKHVCHLIKKWVIGNTVPPTEITLLEEGVEEADGPTQTIEAMAMVLTFMVTMTMPRVVQVIADEIMAPAEEVDFGPEWQLEVYLGICLEEIEEEVTIMGTDTDLDTITMGQVGGLEVDGVEGVEEVLVEAPVLLQEQGQLQVLEEHDDDKHCFSHKCIYICHGSPNCQHR